MPTATQLITRATRDLGNLRPGQGESPDTLSEGLTHLNDIVDELAFERFFIYKADKTVLAAFADLTTNYTLALGYAEFLRKVLALRILPMMKIYLKIPEPVIEPIQEEADRLKMMLQGVGVA